MKSESRFSGERITVFGGGGYVGSCLVPFLLENGQRVVVFDNFATGQDGVQNLQHENLEIFEGDLCDTEAVSQATAGSDTVFLLASVGGGPEEERVERIRNVNFLASSVVLDSAVEHGATRFIFASSDSVYGSQSGIMYETATPEPEDLCARLKLRMEQRVLAARTREFHPTVMRIATCYGVSARMRFDLPANRLIRDAFCEKIISVEPDMYWRSLVHVEDVARACFYSARAHENLVSGAIFNIGAASPVWTTNQVVNLVKGLVPDADVEFQVVSGRSSHSNHGDFSDCRISCSKFEKLLDYLPKRRLEEGLAQVLEYLRDGRFYDPYSVRYAKG